MPNYEVSGGSAIASQRSFDHQPPDRDPGTTVLVVDDEEDGRLRLQMICSLLNKRFAVRVLSARNIQEATQIIFTTPIHVVLLDKNFNLENGTEESGIDAIPQFLRIRPTLQIVMVTGSKSIDDAIQAIRLGAFGYITKETSDDLIVEQIAKAIQMARLTIEKTRLEASAPKEQFFDLVTRSKVTRQLDTTIHAVAESDLPVLLLGESGSGKTTIAKLIHEKRKRFLKQEDRPFFNLNLSAMSPYLIERELFGNEAGAYTGATKMKQGFFELADNGTLFLDEIGEISLEIQKKLLKVLREGVFTRLGGTQEIKTSFKLICATNQNLEEMVQQKQFREDLYYRISTFPIRVPSLRERKEDIPQIIKQLLPMICRENHVYVNYEDLPKDFIRFLTKNPPPGNIAGLEHKISQLLILSPKDKRGNPVLTQWQDIPSLLYLNVPEVRQAITLKDIESLPFDVIGPGFPGFLKFMENIERKIITDAKSKLKRNVEIASVFKISAGAASVKLRKFSEKEEGKTDKGLKQSQSIPQESQEGGLYQ